MNGAIRLARFRKGMWLKYSNGVSIPRRRYGHCVGATGLGTFDERSARYPSSDMDEIVDHLELQVAGRCDIPSLPRLLRASEQC